VFGAEPEWCVGRWHDGARILAVREEPAETLIYKRKELWGEPVFDRLIVNAFSMSSSLYAARRYMNLFVYLPVALHPGLRRALVICYGVGSTAKALTDTHELAEIDVVDTSRDILEMGRLIFPAPDEFPLDDPRVRVRVEDGRFFLLTTKRRYDLITGEPPPLKSAGVVSLYSREYFRMVFDHLEEGGMTSYWLPVYQLEVPETKAVIRAFCDVFEDCSLWTGNSYEWILLGTRHATGPVSEERFARQWHDATVAPTLEALGIEAPEQLGALFLADAASLRQLTSGVAPLVDDHPQRISPRFPRGIDAFYARFMDTGGARDSFAKSSFIAAMWPEKTRAATLAAFSPQALINSVAAHGYGGPEPGIGELAAMLTRTRLRTPVYWTLRSSAREQEIARRASARGRSNRRRRAVRRGAVGDPPAGRPRRRGDQARGPLGRRRRGALRPAVPGGRGLALLRDVQPRQEERLARPAPGLHVWHRGARGDSRLRGARRPIRCLLDSGAW